jgi:hypothetical protein
MLAKDNTHSQKNIAGNCANMAMQDLHELLADPLLQALIASKPRAACQAAAKHACTYASMQAGLLVFYFSTAFSRITTHFLCSC